jgi:hypothetical protein
MLAASGPDFLVGGAFALERYTGIARDTKDFDVFVRPRDRDHTFAVLREAGYQTELTFPHWLGKAFCADNFIDVIFNSGNGVAVVDDEWFVHAGAGEVLGLPVRLCPPEEMIWSKAFVMERERYDGADIAHILRALAERLDWSRLLRRFGTHWPVLLAHLVLFSFIYPGERDRVPAWVMTELLGRAGGEVGKVPNPTRLCRGTLLSRAQYLIDIECWGYVDARLPPTGTMKPADTAHWTAAIEE